MVDPRAHRKASHYACIVWPQHLGRRSHVSNSRIEPNESLRLGLTEIKGATQKAASLTRQLLAFSRKQLIEPTVLDLNASVWEAHKLLRRLIPANIDVIPVLHPDLGKVKADPAQIQQILINLVVNARAMHRVREIEVPLLANNFSKRAAAI